MKKSLYLFLSVITALTLTLSCSDDDNGNIVFDQSPEEGAAGVYTGTFQRVQEGATVPDTTYSDGIMTITPQETNVANIAYKCDEFSIDHSSIANISHSNNGYVFSNNLSSNSFSASFLGRIDDNEMAESHLKLKIRNGRNTTTYNIVFKGHKSGNTVE